MAELRALQIVILLFSVILHEVMHGIVALKFGDRTAEAAGRLTLNPIPHIDLVGTILLPALSLLTGGVIFGWAKPVPVNPLNFSNLRRGELFVSAAGIFANFSLAVVAALLYHLLSILPTTSYPLLTNILSFTVLINLVLGLFNLLPIPPLDGSKILLSQLPISLAKQYQKIEAYGFIILLILLFTGMLGFVFGIARLLAAFLLNTPSL